MTEGSEYSLNIATKLLSCQHRNGACMSHQHANVSICHRNRLWNRQARGRTIPKNQCTGNQSRFSFPIPSYRLLQRFLLYLEVFVISCPKYPQITNIAGFSQNFYIGHMQIFYLTWFEASFVKCIVYFTHYIFFLLQSHNCMIEILV